MFQRCPREFKHRIVDGIEAKEQSTDDKLEFGIAFAKVLELSAGKPAAEWAIGPHVKGLDKELAAQLAGTCSAYADHWAGSLTYLGTEVKLNTPIPGVDRITLTTTFDGLAHDERGDLVVVDQKTTSSDISPGSWFWEKLQLSLQATTYVWAARAHGHPVKHALWDAVKRPTMPRRIVAIDPEHYTRTGKWGQAGDLKPGTGLPAETLLEYAQRVKATMLAATSKWFQRAPVVRLDDEIEACLEDVRAEAKRILFAFDSAEWPRNTNSCFSFGRRCEFWNICTGASSPSDENLYQVREAP